MIYNLEQTYQWRIYFRVLLLFIVLVATALLIVTEHYLYLIVLVPLVIFQTFNIISFLKKTYSEIHQFAESVHYRDFSRYFDVKHAPVEVKTLRRSFNEINSTFKIISRERETQYLYLQKILELVDTGILSFEAETGSVIWINESLKKMLKLPYLKTIHSLGKRDKSLYEDVMTLTPGNSKISVAHLERGNFKILLSATAFQTDDKKYKLIAFQNVNEALDQTESKAWQKLLSVMTHEIMNSVAPISSLAETLKYRLQKLENIEKEAAEDLEIGIETIQRRSEGLLKFARTYRNLNKVSTLNLQKVYVRELIANIHQLMQPTLDQKNIEFEVFLKDPDVYLQADISLLEQVLINLIVNAIDAVNGRIEPRICLSAERTLEDNVVIKVNDNGSGIPEELIEQIFVPFFTTRKNGSGIGLSLCRQIVMMHKGILIVNSLEGKGTTFTIKL